MASEYLAGQEEIVDGVYPLGAVIRRSAGSTLYETEFGEGESKIPAVIRVREVEPAEAERLVQRLDNARRLDHPNLLKIYAVGSSMLNSVSVLYVVMERADESLEGVLAERALTQSETREMVEPVLEALSYLHKNGYMHSRLRPSNVLAVKDELKLSTESVHWANDQDVAEDIRALGVLIVEALTQKIPNTYGFLGSREFAGIPQPLADVVWHCLEPESAGRWTADEVKARLIAPTLVVERMPLSEEHTDAGEARAGMPKWVFAALAALVFAVLLIAVLVAGGGRDKNSTPAAAPVTAATQPDGATAATERVSPFAPDVPRTAPAKTASSAAAKAASGWSVIVGAYGSREPAEKRMRDMTKKWPTFKISVAESHAEKTRYLVVLGRNLSEDEAMALRKRAIQSGFPYDTYIKRAM